MEKSLNSTRNFKLPPIQGAVPAANIIRQPSLPKPYDSWPHVDKQRSTASSPRHRSTLKTRKVIQVASDHFPARYRSPQNHSLTNSTVERRLLNRAIENEKKNKLNLDFAPLVHQFPRTYNVLPPIHKDLKPIGSETDTAISHNDFSKPDIEYESPAENSRRDDKQKLSEALKPEDKSASRGFDLKNNPSNSRKRQRVESERLDKETGERKPSATTILFLKGKRRGRRLGVCLENEPTLINVAEQLKEIFLRKNMEEMYLI